jgi:ferrous iron transport protein A
LGILHYYRRREFTVRTVSDLHIGESGRVVKLRGEGAIKRRIMDMGITKGVTVLVRKVAPLGDPIELNLRGYELSLRKADAAMIEIE